MLECATKEEVCVLCARARVWMLYGLKRRRVYCAHEREYVRCISSSCPCVHMSRMRTEFESTACATFTQAWEYMFWRIVKPAHGDGRPQHRGTGSGKMREGGNMRDRRDQNPVYCARARCHESRPHSCTFQFCHRYCKSTSVYTACTDYYHLR